MDIKKNKPFWQNFATEEKNLDNFMKTIVEEKIFLEKGFMQDDILNLWWWWNKKGGVCP